MWHYYLLANQKSININTNFQLLYLKNYQCSPTKLTQTKKQVENEKNQLDIPLIISHFRSQIELTLTQSCWKLTENTQIIQNKKESKSVKNLNYSTNQSKEKLYSNKNLKSLCSPDYEKRKNPGRNSTSNIFRVFLKVCFKPKFQKHINDKFNQVAKLHSLFISFDYFKIRLKELSPSTSNYINLKQFKKIWQEETEFSRAFRCLFHWFLNSFAVNHSLTLKGKNKMMRQSIIHFLNNLHSIEDDLFENQERAINEQYQLNSSKGQTTK